MPTQWLQITLESERPLDVERVFEACGAVSVTILDAADDPLYEPLPGETPMWALSRVRGLFNEDADPDAILAIVTRKLELVSAPPHDIEPISDQDWSSAWQKDFTAMCFGERLWICPSHSSVDQEDAVVIRLDPGLAFGTGTHPTTAMCLQYLDASPPLGKTVIDYGCGSGILAIAAGLLGATNVQACDIDPQAVAATKENAAANNIAERITAIDTSISPDPDITADLVLANILSNALTELQPRILKLCKPGGVIVMTGILGEQAETVINAYSKECSLESHQIQGDWHCLVVRKAVD